MYQRLRTAFLAGEGMLLTSDELRKLWIDNVELRHAAGQDDENAVDALDRPSVEKELEAESEALT